MELGPNPQVWKAATDNQMANHMTAKRGQLTVPCFLTNHCFSPMSLYPVLQLPAGQRPLKVIWQGTPTLFRDETDSVCVFMTLVPT